jgi:hypothetical protein
MLTIFSYITIEKRMDLIRQVLKTRQDMHKPKVAPKVSTETEELTMATIIENRVKPSEVIKYFRKRADECDGSL